MEKIRFKLEDNAGFLEAHYEEDNRLVEFLLELNGIEGQPGFKLHRIQLLALIKAINEPLNLELAMKR